MPSLAIIPDIHMRAAVFHHALDLAEEGHDVVLLGDYVDNGPRANDPLFLREIFAFCRKAKAIPLIGNHDLAYLYPAEERFRKNGYEPNNAEAIAQVFDDYRDLFRFAHLVGPYLMSHAGLSDVFVEWMAAKYHVEGAAAVVDLLNTEHPLELFWCSPHNDGQDPFDGPTWLRLPQYRGAFQEEGITQVVGHSSQATIRVKHNLWMIDVRLPMLVEW